MKRVQMRGERPDDYKGAINVSVEPSLRVKPGFGVYFRVNDHYETDPEEKGPECDRIMEILALSWQTSLERAHHIMQALMTIS